VILQEENSHSNEEDIQHPAHGKKKLGWITNNNLYVFVYHGDVNKKSSLISNLWMSMPLDIC